MKEIENAQYLLNAFYITFGDEDHDSQINASL